MAIFYPNFDKPPVQVNSIEDILAYMGDALSGFGALRIDGNKVLTHFNGQYICIGLLKGVI